MVGPVCARVGVGAAKGRAGQAGPAHTGFEQPLLPIAGKKPRAPVGASVQRPYGSHDPSRSSQPFLLCPPPLMVNIWNVVCRLLRTSVGGKELQETLVTQLPPR